MRSPVEASSDDDTTRGPTTLHGPAHRVSWEPRYRRIGRIGQGGNGSVDLLHDGAIGRRVAQKRLRPTRRTPAHIEEFLAEIRVVGQLEHPSIVPIHDAGFDERGHYFTMKYVEGDTMETIIAALARGDAAYVARYPVSARVALFQKLLEAVSFAHARGFLHRDLKPANVLVGPHGEVMLTDWGLAIRHEDAAVSSTVAVGTPAYMAPEQVLAAPVDVRADVYGLSVLFFELLALHHFLDLGRGADSTFRAILHEDPPGAIAMHHVHGVPPELAHFVRRGLEKDPAARWQSVDAMRAALSAIAAGQVPVACPCTGLKRAGGMFGALIDRHPLPALGIAAASLFFAGFGVLSLVQRLL